MFGKYLVGEVPFKDIYLHGMVLDKNGKKMSKSKGNVISPVEVAETYGIDALRMALTIGTPPGADTSLSLEKINGYKKFANKIWNATRFVLENISTLDFDEMPEYDAEDQQSIDELHAFLKEITKEMEEYKFYIVSEKLYHYFWHTFADIIIERSKKKIAEGSTSAAWALYTHLNLLLKALHPFMPFITEEIWSILPEATDAKKLLMIESWPISEEMESSTQS
jgi:valyl-tRNA synthetase